MQKGQKLLLANSIKATVDPEFNGLTTFNGLFIVPGFCGSGGGIKGVPN